MIDPSPVGAVHDPHYIVTVITVFLAAVIFNFVGPSLTALRIISGIMGIISVGMVYLLATEMFREEAGERARYVGLASGGLMAVSLWLLGVSRIGWAPPAALMLGTIFFYFVWKAINTKRLKDYALAGLFLALAQYGHITARFLPFALGLFLTLNLLWNLISRRVSDSLICRQWRGWVVMGIVALVGSLPIIQYYLRFPEDFLRRASLVSPAFAPSLSHREQAAATLDSLISKVQVLGLDPIWLFSHWTDTLLSPIVAILFGGGLILSLLRLSRRQYQFLLAGWAIMSMPAWLTSSSDAHFLKLYDYARRGILAAPFTFIIAGMFLAELGAQLQKWTKKSLPAPLSGMRYKLVVALATTIVLLAGCRDYHVYFSKWPSNPTIEQAFSPRFLPTLQKLEEISEQGTVFLFPINTFDDTTQRPDLYSIGFLYQGNAPFAVMTNDETALSQTLSEVTQGHAVVYLFQTSEENDPKQAIAWLLSAFGKHQPTAPEIPGYQIDVFDLNSTTGDFANLPKSVIVEVPFGSYMQLNGHRYGSNLMARGFAPQQVETGDKLLIDLSWEVTAEGAPDYNLAVILRDSSERIITQVDYPLVNAAGLTSAKWRTGVVENEYLSLPLPVGLAPGEYWLDAVLYDAATFRREASPNSRGDLSYRLGRVMVTPATDISSIADRLDPSMRKPIQVTPFLQMAGYSLQTDNPLFTGDMLRGTIYWQAVTTMNDDATADYVLVGPGSSVVPLGQPVLLGGVAYPTHRWRASEIVADHLALRIPPDVPSGLYGFGARLTDSKGRTLAELPLGEATINSWKRSFQLPPDVSPLTWQLGESIRLVGTRLPQSASRGKALPVQLYWQTEQDIPLDYVAYVHVLDETGHLVAQHDSVPGQGQRPVPGWLVGEIVEDHHDVVVPADVAPGVYRVTAGLYDASSGVRLPVLDSSEESGDGVHIGLVEFH
jgi:hypothetical protein